MKRRPVESSALASVGYDAATGVLEIEFTSGEVYRYFAVPPSAHRGLLAADSRGRFFRDCIRERYPTERVPRR
ncbi:KTSC domain-containing protein [Microbacterium caowuchunii]|uniref:KTSC domain-containing protein n=1 Tax=Microbacterium caowuchunii TaxID=2614638 RepID=A0A5N0T5Z3_9MICO|nr:KTSC domain-containing protein [Microbacterium caowuchunii]KAA9130363.1 KTSC domain-containing protein [Microbacterium caowuchunii]